MRRRSGEDSIIGGLAIFGLLAVLMPVFLLLVLQLDASGLPTVSSVGPLFAAGLVLLGLITVATIAVGGSATFRRGALSGTFRGRR